VRRHWGKRTDNGNTAHAWSPWRGERISFASKPHRVLDERGRCANGCLGNPFLRIKLALGTTPAVFSGAATHKGCNFGRQVHFHEFRVLGADGRQASHNNASRLLRTRLRTQRPPLTAAAQTTAQ
jgi:hypothetical protein